MSYLVSKLDSCFLNVLFLHFQTFVYSFWQLLKMLVYLIGVWFSFLWKAELAESPSKLSKLTFFKLFPQLNTIFQSCNRKVIPHFENLWIWERKKNPPAAYCRWVWTQAQQPVIPYSIHHVCIVVSGQCDHTEDFELQTFIFHPGSSLPCLDLPLSPRMRYVFVFCKFFCTKSEIKAWAPSSTLL